MAIVENGAFAASWNSLGMVRSRESDLATTGASTGGLTFGQVQEEYWTEATQNVGSRVGCPVLTKWSRWHAAHNFSA